MGLLGETDGVRFTFENAGRTINGTVTKAEQRCDHITGWDDEWHQAIRCSKTRPADATGPWPCGHDHAVGVLHVVSDDLSESGEAILDVDTVRAYARR